MIVDLAAGLVVALLAGATVAGRDLWPFSHYPMFAGPLDGDALRFFRLRLHLPHGRCAVLSGSLDALVDPFHRRCEHLWGAGPPPAEAATAVAVRTWREACRMDGTLAAAESLEIVMHLAEVLEGARIVVTEETVHVVATDGRLVDE